MIGKTLGPYRIEEKIGRGGMATVYRAFEAGVERDVAIKVMHDVDLDNESFRMRFLREAQTVAKLEHFHILPIYAYGEEDDTAYFVMRYISTGTLTDLIEKGPIPLKEASRIFKQIASALDYAHERGVIHRDIKPANILMDENNNAYLTDFGIAKIYQATVQLTGEGNLVGTPTYMSPEQCQGFDLTPASDIYALGIILYEMLLGRVPFQSETPIALINMHVNMSPPPPRTLQADMPRSVENVLLKALAKEPTERYQTATVFAEALEEAIEEEDGTLDVGLMALEPTEPVPLKPLNQSQSAVDISTNNDATQVVTKTSPLLLGVGGVLIGLLVAVIALVGVGIFILSQTNNAAGNLFTDSEQPPDTNNDNDDDEPNGPGGQSPAAYSGPVELEPSFEITDDFDDPAFDEDYNEGKWTFLGTDEGSYEIFQRNGRLEIRHDNKAPFTPTGLAVVRLDNTELDSPAYIAADFRVDDRNSIYGSVFIAITAVQANDDVVGAGQCIIEGGEEDGEDMALSFCTYFYGDEDESGYRYSSEVQVMENREWQSAFIMVDPNLGQWSYWLNGEELDQYTMPISDLEAFEGARYFFEIGIWGSDDRPIKGFFDDVRAGIIEE